jgi:hypothetical protein
MKNTKNPNTNAILSDLHAIKSLVATLDLEVRADATRGDESTTDEDAKLVKAVRSALSAAVDTVRSR